MGEGIIPLDREKMKYDEGDTGGEEGEKEGEKERRRKKKKRKRE